MNGTRMPRTTGLAPLVTGGLLLALTACGGPPGSDSSGGATAEPQPSQSAAGQTSQNTRFPGTSGLLAALTGATLQVQSPQSGQVAVTYTAKTTFAKTVAAKAADVTVGSCVTVRPTGTSSSTAVTADSISISRPVRGSCLGRGGFGGGPGGGGPVRSGAGGAPPSDAPTDRPTGAPQLSGTVPTIGTVTDVTGTSFTVAALAFDRPPATAAPQATPSTRAVTVTTAGATTYRKTVAGSAKDLEVGQCVQALGTADDTGAITATSISTEPAVDGQCGGGRPTTVVNR
jgi:hypothetical protein